ncbi:hypothetical protein [Nocardia sp. NPDC002869]|uniref:hypothetical protein n=1 Tax=Nocardia sp. NPDC002869 TaxID=3161032 RepID=UPI00398D2202
MDRAGLKMDTPGLLISEPRDVAAQGLANLANGPVVVVKQFEPAADLGGERMREHPDQYRQNMTLRQKLPTVGRKTTAFPGSGILRGEPVRCLLSCHRTAGVGS